MREHETERVPRLVKAGLVLGSALLLLTGLLMGMLLREVASGALLFASGTMLFALRGFIETETGA
jgi:hypothetical protein